MADGEQYSFEPTVAVSSGSLTEAKLNSMAAWCAATDNVNQYFQYDLGSVKQVSGIAIQGNRGLTDWVKSFKVQYGQSSSALTTYLEGGIQKVCRPI